MVQPLHYVRAAGRKPRLKETDEVVEMTSRDQTMRCPHCENVGEPVPVGLGRWVLCRFCHRPIDTKEDPSGQSAE